MPKKKEPLTTWEAKEALYKAGALYHWSGRLSRDAMRQAERLTGRKFPESAGHWSPPGSVPAGKGRASRSVNR